MLVTLWYSRMIHMIYGGITFLIFLIIPKNILFLITKGVILLKLEGHLLHIRHKFINQLFQQNFMTDFNVQVALN